MPEPGWYQDPHNPNQQRYWDGSTWTEHTHDAPFHIPEAPQPDYGPGYVNDIGDWLSRSFKVLFANIAPLFILVLIALVPSALSAWLLAGSLEDAVLDLDSGEFLNWNGGLFSIAILVLIASAIFSVTVGLAQAHLLHRGHLGLDTTLGQSLSAGLKGTLRYIGWSIVIFLGFFGIVLAAAILVGVGALIHPALAVLLGIVAVIGAIAAAVWLWVKVGFLRVSAAVAPSSVSALRTSFDRSAGRFWPVFGRLLLLGIITGIVGSVISGIVSPSYFDAFSVDVNGDPTLDGVPFDDLEELRLGDVLPYRSDLMVATIISSLLSAVIGLFARSGEASLYGDLNGPHAHEAGDTTAPAIG